MSVAAKLSQFPPLLSTYLHFTQIEKKRKSTRAVFDGWLHNIYPTRRVSLFTTTTTFLIALDINGKGEKRCNAS